MRIVVGIRRKSVAAVTLCVAAMTVIAMPLASQQKPAAQAAWATVEDALGRSGAMQAGDVIKFSFPRSDLSVTVAGVAVKPALALGSWVAFKKIGKAGAMAMGDLVLTEDEISAVMRALQAGGVEQTALHNHVLGESPRVMYMHIRAHGDAAKIARAIHDALAQSKTPLGPPAPPRLDPSGCSNVVDGPPNARSVNSSDWDFGGCASLWSVSFGLFKVPPIRT